jgi:hypothetical protein
LGSFAIEHWMIAFTSTICNKNMFGIISLDVVSKPRLRWASLRLGSRAPHNSAGFQILILCFNVFNKRHTLINRIRRVIPPTRGRNFRLAGYIAAGSRCHISMMHVWERLSAAIERNSFDCKSRYKWEQRVNLFSWVSILKSLQSAKDLRRINPARISGGLIGPTLGF